MGRGDSIVSYRHLSSVPRLDRDRLDQDVLSWCGRSFRVLMYDDACAVCGIPAEQRCARCQQVVYCGRDHQRQHWKGAHRDECRCYKVTQNSLLGRHVVAARRIHQGELIYRDSPLVLGPKISSVPLCLGCNRSLTPLLASDGKLGSRKDFYTCRRCGWPLCSESCETAPTHLEECRLMSARGFKPRISFNARDPEKKESAYCVIVPLRAILLKKLDVTRYANLLTLESHIETRINTPLYAVVKSNLVPFIRNVLGLAGQVSEEEIMQIAGIFDTNSYEVRVPDRDIKIRALYELGAMMSHSCRPNTKHYFDEKLNLNLVATVDIAKDDVISISYTQPLMATIQRRFAIKQAKCFECGCERCQDPTEFQTYTGSIVCPNCTKAMMTADYPLDFRSGWQCESRKCSYRESAQQYIKRNEDHQAAILRLTKTCPEEYERFLEEHQETLHPWNTNVLQVKYALTQLYGGQLKEQKLRELPTAQLQRRVDLCVDLLDVADRLEPGLSTFRAKLLMALRDTLLVLREKLGPHFDSSDVQLPLQVNLVGQPCSTGRNAGKGKPEPPLARTMKQHLDSSQREIKEMIKSDPTLQRL